jgi:uncharacterized protein (DUF111 family)
MTALETLLFAETGTLGLRRTTVHTARLCHVQQRPLWWRGQRIRLKQGPWGVKAEHDDLVAAAKALHRPLSQIAAQALTAAHANAAVPEDQE